MRPWLLCLVLGGCDWAFGIMPVDGPLPDAVTAPGRWATVTAGAAHVCGIDLDGHASCWGDDQDGQLGLPSSTQQPQSLGPMTWSAIAAGARHTCGIQNGVAWCWGLDDNAQVDGTFDSNVFAPRAVPLPPNTPPLTAISAGGFESCALGGGRLWCWGDPLATTSGTTGPSEILSGASWSKLSVGYDHVCAVDAADSLFCWGANYYGQCAEPSQTATVKVPARVAIDPSHPHVRSLAAGTNLTCAVLATAADAPGGQIWCWGNNDANQISGDGADEHAPTQVTTGDDWTDVVAGSRIVCGFHGADATCWGQAARGGFGDGRWSQKVLPSTGAAALHADVLAIGRGGDGEENLCAISNHNLGCWGDNRGGQLGSAPTLHAAAITVPSPSSQAWVKVAVGTSHTCARDLSGTTYCWGADDLGQVTGMAGHGSTVPCTTSACDQAMPVAAPVTTSKNAIVGGGDYTCAHTADSIVCWGSNAAGQLGVTDKTAHVGTRAVDSKVDLIGGGHATCDLGIGTSLECWGVINNAPTTGVQSIADPMNALVGIYAIAFGDGDTCAIVTGNRRACWGSNFQGELGTGATASIANPTINAGDLTMYVAISMATRHACTVVGATAVKCWGSDYSYETGQQKPDPNDLTTAPTPVGTLTACTQVSTSDAFSCAVCGQQVSCWGDNEFGRLGRATTTPPADFNAVAAGMPTGHKWVELGSGDTHSCAIAVDGTLACWGLGARGQLGDGGHGSSVPVPIATP